VVKNGITINGQFPGPLIEANWGDWIEVKVTNQLTDEGTSIHWHGILQKGTPWYDGVPSVSQCPIAPGQSFTYRFRADLYGSSWYHCMLCTEPLG
jgi:FtsP/CotA-like multicopper oxidase with cupredoxin domain